MGSSWPRSRNTVPLTPHTYTVEGRNLPSHNEKNLFIYFVYSHRVKAGRKRKKSVTWSGALPELSKSHDSALTIVQVTLFTNTVTMAIQYVPKNSKMIVALGEFETISLKSLVHCLKSRV
jgi:hypothetical protein